MLPRHWRYSTILSTIAVGFALLVSPALGVPELAEIKLAAEAGDPVAQYQLAERFTLRMDTAQAELWYRKSAAQGYAPAQGTLGSRLLFRYRISPNLPADERAALAQQVIALLRAAADQVTPPHFSAAVYSCYIVKGSPP